MTKAEIRTKMRRRRKAVAPAERAAASAKICAWLGEKVKAKGEGEQRNDKNPLLTLTSDLDLKLPTANPQLTTHNPQPTTLSTIAAYLASPDEIDLTHFIETCLSHHFRLVAPRWNGTAYELAELNGCWPDGLAEGPHGILEPPACAALVKPDAVDLWIVPGLAFAKGGQRLGYGGGWYDRLMRDSSGRKVGVGYGFQLADTLPSEPHDIRLDDLVLT